MAFQAILNGSDCGPSNPIKTLLNHIQRDPQSIQSDHFSKLEPSSSSSISSSNQSQFNSIQSHHHHQNLFHQNNHLLNNDSQFLLSHKDYNHQESLPHQSNSKITPEERNLMERSFQQETLNETRFKIDQEQQEEWKNEFSSTQLEIPSNQESLRNLNLGINSNQFMNSRFHQFNNLESIGGIGALMGSSSIIFNSTSKSNQNQTQEEKNQLIELSDENWEAEFAKVGTDSISKKTETKSNQTQNQNQRIHQRDPSDLEDEAEDDAAFMRSLENTWKNLNLTNSIQENELNQWSKEFENSDYHSSSILNSENIINVLKDSKPYPYQTELEFNKYKDISDPLEEGKRLISIGAPLSEASLAFEAACQLNPNRGEAWRMLGETNAADEKEFLAIKAFEKSIGCGGIDGESSWMSLAIGWVNEGYELRALVILEKWLEITYPNVIQNFKSNSIQEKKYNPWERHLKVIDMFLEAARAGTNQREGELKEIIRIQSVDHEIQIGLGVLFYSNNDFLRAKDCFETALNVKPNDYLLWNRLGATLANGGSPELAIEAYRKALEIKPNFTRAIYNLGVSCMNINCFKEGAEHLLAAISLHQKSLNYKFNGLQDIQTNPIELKNESHDDLPDGDGSQNLYRTLQRAFICLDRQDLADRVKLGVNVEIFKSEGFEF